MRAQKNKELHAIKDNKGRWLWNPEELDAWAKKRPDEPKPTKEKVDKFADLSLALGKAEGKVEGLEIALKQSNEEAQRWRIQSEKERERADLLASRRWVFPWT